MKILILHNKYQITGGEDSVVLNEKKLLEQNGHKVKVLYFDNADIKGGLQKLKTAVTSIYNATSNKIIKNAIAEFKPDVIHIHNFFPKISPSVFYLANQLQIPIVQTIHNYRLICPGALLMRNEQVCEVCVNKPFAFSAIKHNCYRDSALQTGVVATVNFVHNQLGTWQNKVDGFIFLTDFARSKFLESNLRLDAAKLFIKTNFVEDKGFAQNREEHFLFVGRLSKEKGINVLLTAFKKCQLKIKIIGTGPLEAEVLEAAKIHRNIQFLGKQPIDVVIEQMKLCKALVFPSIWYEGMPMTILEAFSTGCPVIASELGSMQSLIKHSYNGLHFKVGNAGDLLQKLDLITEAMSLNARETYLETYTPEQNHQDLISIYDQVTNAKATDY